LKAATTALPVEVGETFTTDAAHFNYFKNAVDGPMMGRAASYISPPPVYEFERFCLICGTALVVFFV
jgi:hypothetical protein